MAQLALDPAILLLLQMIVILAVSRLLGSLFSRLGQPVVVAEILAGLALGPSLLGALWPAGLATLFPPASLGTLNTVAQLGLVLFMFVIGLEFDPSLLRGRARVAVAAAASSIIVPFVAGLALGYAMHPVFAADQVEAGPFALFIGAAMCVTAFPVLARILSEQGLTRTELGALALSSAAANDVAAWCILAFVVASLQPGGPSQAALVTALAATFVAVQVLVVGPFSRRLLTRFTTRQGISRAGLATLMLMLLASALISHAIGVHALFGAFVFGAVLPRDPRLIRALTLRIEDMVVLVFLPLFFAATGLRTQVGLISGGQMWAWCGVILLVATLGKVLGAALPARLGGLPWRESATFGVLMNTRGLMELILLEIGRSLGVLPPVVFTMFVLMAVGTTLCTTPFVRLLYPRQRILAARAAALGPPVTPVTSPASALLTCISDPHSAAGLGCITAALTAGGDSRAYALTLGSIQDRSTFFPESSVTPVADAADALAAAAARAGQTVTVLSSFASGDPGRDICEVARLKQADLILVGTHRPLLGRALLGGPLVTITRDFDGDVAVLVDRGLREVRTVLVLEGGAHGPGVDRVAARLAHNGAQISRRSADDARALASLDAGTLDLIVLGADPALGAAPHLLDLRKRIPLDELRCSVLVVHGSESGL